MTIGLFRVDGSRSKLIVHNRVNTSREPSCRGEGCREIICCSITIHSVIQHAVRGCSTHDNMSRVVVAGIGMRCAKCLTRALECSGCW